MFCLSDFRSECLASWNGPSCFSFLVSVPLSPSGLMHAKPPPAILGGGFEDGKPRVLAANISLERFKFKRPDRDPCCSHGDSGSAGNTPKGRNRPLLSMSPLRRGASEGGAPSPEVNVTEFVQAWSPRRHVSNPSSLFPGVCRARPPAMGESWQSRPCCCHWPLRFSCPPDFHHLLAPSPLPLFATVCPPNPLSCFYEHPLKGRLSLFEVPCVVTYFF